MKKIIFIIILIIILGFGLPPLISDTLMRFSFISRNTYERLSQILDIIGYFLISMTLALILIGSGAFATKFPILGITLTSLGGIVPFYYFFVIFSLLVRKLPLTKENLLIGTDHGIISLVLFLFVGYVVNTIAAVPSLNKNTRLQNKIDIQDIPALLFIGVCFFPAVIFLQILYAEWLTNTKIDYTVSELFLNYYKLQTFHPIDSPVRLSSFLSKVKGIGNLEVKNLFQTMAYALIFIGGLGQGVKLIRYFRDYFAKSNSSN
jgi:hypothetical protein